MRSLGEGRIDGPRPDKVKANEVFEDVGTVKYPDGATSEKSFEGFVARRYNPYGLWTVISYEGGAIPQEFAGLFTTFDEVQRAIRYFLEKNKT